MLAFSRVVLFQEAVLLIIQLCIGRKNQDLVAGLRETTTLDDMPPMIGIELGQRCVNNSRQRVGRRLGQPPRARKSRR